MHPLSRLSHLRFFRKGVFDLRHGYHSFGQTTTTLHRNLTRTVVTTPSIAETDTESEPASSTKSRNRRRLAPVALEVTPEAQKRILQLLSQREPPPAGVRIGLRTRGCNGMAYVLNYADEASKFDEKVAFNGGHVFIDPRALMHIVGTKMDFIDNDLVSEFVFHNPNAKGTCGCGESFNI